MNETTRATFKRKKSSFVWKYYTQDESGESATCNSCKKKIRTPTGSTSGLVSHIGQHKDIETEFKKLKEEASKVDVTPSTKQATLFDVLKKKEIWKNDSQETSHLNSKVAAFLIKGFHSYSTVEEPAFIELLKTCQPLYKCPSRTTFSKKIIPEIYDKTVQQLKEEIAADIRGGVSAVSFTTDTWTSKANNGYISLTLHYVSKDWVQKSRTLCVRHFPGSHTASNIQQVLSTLMEDWRIPNDGSITVFFVTDNGKNFVSAITSEHLWTHLQCLAHTLQLAIKDAKQETPTVEKLLSKARSIVGRYKRSSIAKERLEQRQIQDQKIPLSVVQDVETRWNSEFHMLERLLELKEYIAAELVSSNSSVDCLSTQEWATAEGMVNVLRPIEKATNDLSGNKYATRSMAIPFLHFIESSIEKSISNSVKCSVFAKNLMKTLKSRFPFYKEDKVNLLCMVLDPRFKMTLLNVPEQNTALMHLKSSLGDISSVVEETTETNDEESASCDDLSLWSAVTHVKKLSENSTIDDEISSYLNEVLVNRKQDVCFWYKSVGSFKYPNISKLAAQYLSIPATSVPSECLFSATGNTVTSRRTQLSPEHVNQLCFLHDNF